MRILGIDPGVATTGWGVVEDSKAADNGLISIDYGVITTPKEMEQGDRLLELQDGMEEIIAEFAPEVVAVEQLFFCKNVKTALSVGEARGVILSVAARAEVPIEEYTPLQVKDAVCGSGNAPKQQVQQMVQSILNLDELPRPDDAADGLALAICAAGGMQLKEAADS